MNERKIITLGNENASKLDSTTKHKILDVIAKTEISPVIVCFDNIEWSTAPDNSAFYFAKDGKWEKVNKETIEKNKCNHVRPYCHSPYLAPKCYEPNELKVIYCGWNDYYKKISIVGGLSDGLYTLYDLPDENGLWLEQDSGRFMAS